MPIRACIDIGSNTTRLLVAEPEGDGLREIAARRSFTRVGHGLGDGGAIGPAKLAEVADVVAAQARLARSLGSDSIEVVATAAVRRAPNRSALADAVRQSSGLEVRVLSAEVEARLAFQGAAQALSGPDTEDIGVVDVGGGSTEVAVGTVAAGVGWWASIALGSSGLSERHLSADPPAARELEAMADEVGEAFAGLQAPAVGRAVAVGGSASSLRALVGPQLGGQALLRALDVLADSPVKVVATRSGLDPQRVRLLPAGIIILREAGQVLGVALECGHGGLREGVLLEAFTNARPS